MSQDSVRSQIEDKLKLDRLDLKAVVFHSEEWDEIVVVGSTTVKDCIEADFPDSVVSYRSFQHLTVVPDSEYTCDASVYGVEKGTVLLVTGIPERF